MELIIQKTKKDYIRFYTFYFFKRKQKLRLCLAFGLAIYCSVISDSKTLTEYIVKFLIFASLFSFCIFVLPYISSLFRLNKWLRTKKEMLEKTKISIVETGIEIEREKTVVNWNWDSIDFIENSSEYLNIVLREKKGSFFISKTSFESDNNAKLFYENIQSKLTNEKGHLKDQDGKHLYRYGWIGLIPNIGVIAGMILIYNGIFKYSNKKLVIIGIADILFTIVFWSIFTSENIQNKLFADTDEKLAQTQVNSLVKDIEFYKIQHGEYPDSLEQINDSSAFVWITDPFLNKGKNKKDVNFHYVKIRTKYTLFSVGSDKIPNTKDDIYPTVTMGDTIKFGLVKK